MVISNHGKSYKANSLLAKSIWFITNLKDITKFYYQFEDSDCIDKSLIEGRIRGRYSYDQTEYYPGISYFYDSLKEWTEMYGTFYDLEWAYDYKQYDPDSPFNHRNISKSIKSLTYGNYYTTCEFEIED